MYLKKCDICEKIYNNEGWTIFGEKGIGKKSKLVNYHCCNNICLKKQVDDLIKKWR